MPHFNKVTMRSVTDFAIFSATSPTLMDSMIISIFFDSTFGLEKDLVCSTFFRGSTLLTAATSVWPSSSVFKDFLVFLLELLLRLTSAA